MDLEDGSDASSEGVEDEDSPLSRRYRAQLEAQRRQQVDAEGHQNYVEGLKARARQTLAQLHAQTDQQDNMETVGQLELELAILAQVEAAACLFHCQSPEQSTAAASDWLCTWFLSYVTSRTSNDLLVLQKSSIVERPLLWGQAHILKP